MLPQIDRSNAIFDVRQRLVANYVWELPWMKEQHGFIGAPAGRLAVQRIISWQTGAHWEPGHRATVGIRLARRNSDGDPNNPFVAGCTQAQIDSGLALTSAATSTLTAFAMIA
jgi:hypothetical protein